MRTATLISTLRLPRFDYQAPPTLDALVAGLAEAGAEGCVLAGGTDLMVKMKRRIVRPRVVLSLKRITELAGVRRTGTGVRIGPMTTMAEAGESCVLTDGFAALAEGARSVGGPLIRNRATVGGNIVSARPCADTVPPLMALDAVIDLRGPVTQRTIALDGFITGPGRTGIQAGEVLTGVSLPAPDGVLRGSCYLKMTRRAAMEVTIVGCAARVDLEEDGATVRAARLVLASVAPVPLRVRGAEEAIEGRVPCDTDLRLAASIAREAARPIDDCRAPADYRSDLVEVLSRRALTLAAARARAAAAK